MLFKVTFLFVLYLLTYLSPIIHLLAVRSLKNKSEQTLI